MKLKTVLNSHMTEPEWIMKGELCTMLAYRRDMCQRTDI